MELHGRKGGLGHEECLSNKVWVTRESREESEKSQVCLKHIPYTGKAIHVLSQLDCREHWNSSFLGPE